MQGLEKFHSLVNHFTAIFNKTLYYKEKLSEGRYDLSMIPREKWYETKQVSVGDKFVYQLVLESYNDTEMQTKILKKIVEYTGHTKMYLSGVQFKAVHFEQMLKKMELLVMECIKKNLSNEKPFDFCYVVSFDVKRSEKSSNPSEMCCHKIYSRIMTNNDMDCVEHEQPNFYTDGTCGAAGYSELLLRSIVGKETITNFGYDGFMALLIIKLYEEIIDEELIALKQNSSEKISFEKYVAEQFNYIHVQPVIEIDMKNIQELSQTTNQSVWKIVAKKIGLQEKLGHWFRTLELATKIPAGQFESCRPYMHEYIQRALFKQVEPSKENVNYGTWNEISLYHKNYDAIFDELLKTTVPTKRDEMMIKINFYKTIFKISTLSEWLDFLHELKQMPDAFIISFLLTIDECFMRTLVGNVHFINKIDVTPFCLAIAEQHYFRMVNGKCCIEFSEFYEQGLKTFNKKIKTEIFVYNKDLNVIDKRIESSEFQYYGNN